MHGLTMYIKLINVNPCCLNLSMYPRSSDSFQGPGPHTVLTLLIPICFKRRIAFISASTGQFITNLGVYSVSVRGHFIAGSFCIKGRPDEALDIPERDKAAIAELCFIKSLRSFFIALLLILS